MGKESRRPVDSITHFSPLKAETKNKKIAVGSANSITHFSPLKAETKKDKRAVGSTPFYSPE